MLTNYKGTLLIVSHDRDFLDQTVNKILYFEGNGKVSIFMGGYSDFLKRKDKKNPVVLNNTEKNNKHEEVKKFNNKLSFKFKYELEILPKEIARLKEKIFEIKNELKDSNLYLNDHDRFTNITKELAEKQLTIENKEIRWLELMEMEERLEN